MFQRSNDWMNVGNSGFLLPVLTLDRTIRQRVRVRAQLPYNEVMK